ncbi:MAG: hypothetical protein P8Y07_02065, partial [Gemmatimonadales bacterium]
VTFRYQEAIDFSEYEPRIKKLIDTHVGDQTPCPLDLVVPGEHFGLDGFIRIGFGGEEAELVSALACIGRALEARAAERIS